MPTEPSLGNILIVDADDNISELLKINLGSEGYAVRRVLHAREVEHDSLGDVSLIIVDSIGEEYSGMDLIYDLKDNPLTEHVGIILYSNIKGERMIIDALDAGADDYIVKPFSLREMVARVKSLLRRRVSVKSAAGTVVTIDNMYIDLQSQAVRVDGNTVPLTRTEYAILALLVKNINTYVTRMEIHRRVWAEDSAGTNERIVDTNISRLRKKLGEVGNRIVNRSGYGYLIS